MISLEQLQLQLFPSADDFYLKRWNNYGTIMEQVWNNYETILLLSFRVFFFFYPFISKSMPSKSIYELYLAHFLKAF